MDIATCGKESDAAVWYENDGDGNFVRNLIGRNQGAYDIRAIDMDGDHDLDLLIADMQATMSSGLKIHCPEWSAFFELAFASLGADRQVVGCGTSAAGFPGLIRFGIFRVVFKFASRPFSDRRRVRPL